MARNYGNITDDEDFLELIELYENHNENRRAQRVYRQRRNHFEMWTEGEFRERYRLSKNTVRFLINEISEEISNQTPRNHSLSAEDMVLVTLRFLAAGCFLKVSGDCHGIHESTVSRTVNKVTRAIAAKHSQFIKMPSSPEEISSVKQGFFMKARFPKCIGAIDGTHIKIQAPNMEEPEVFRCRKGFFSYNVQAVCDANLKIRNIVCRWPGSTHDSTIFQNSNLRTKFEMGEFGDSVLIGDSGYGITNYLITPLNNPVTRAEQLFNESLIRTRNTVERTFGVWKRRFPILSTGIRLDYRKVEAIVVATAVLHNIAIEQNEPNFDIDGAMEMEVNFDEEENQNRIAGQNNTRNKIIDYFQSLL